MKAGYILLVFVLLSGANACNKAVDPGAPPTSLSRTSVYQNNATAAGVLGGLYSDMVNGNTFGGGLGGLSIHAGLAADELNLYSTDVTLSQFYTNSLLSTNTGITTWSDIYNFIYVANAALEGLSSSSSLTVSVKQQLMGEALFSRAFLYFYAVNLFGDVPLLTTTDYNANAVAANAPQAKVYQQIVTDLTQAQGLLNSKYLGPDAMTVTIDRVRPTSWAAAALLARVYLFTGDWVHAEMLATQVIGNSAQFSLVTDPNQVFLANSNEAIWQLQPGVPTQNTSDGLAFILYSSPVGSIGSPISLSQDLLSVFEPGDVRRSDWVQDTSFDAVSYSYAFKYKVKGGTGASIPLSEYVMVLRLAEQYLIRAEARAEQGNITGANGALGDLNAIRRRAGLSGYGGSTDKVSVLTAIMHERQVELFTEQGQRWLDLKRTGVIDAVMDTVTLQKGGGTWNSTKASFPIPNTDILNDPNLMQNAGYN